MLFHMLDPQPEAGEASRGYLHGGILIDFVGQEGPISKSRLVVLDLLTLALQLLVLAAFLERQKLRTPTTSAEGSTGATTAGTTEAGLQGQDHDSEERGVLRPDPGSSEDIELQPLHSSAGRTGGEEDGERDELLSESQQLGVQDSSNHPLDAFYTGEHISTELHILDSIRSQGWLTGEGGVEGSSSSTAATAASFASSRLGIRMRFGGNGLGS